MFFRSLCMDDCAPAAPTLSRVRLRPMMCAPALCQGTACGLQLTLPQIDQRLLALVNCCQPQGRVLH